MMLAEVLDSVERGESVVIERQGVRFQIVAKPGKAHRRRAPVLEVLDPAVENGGWTWTQGPSGLKFTPRTRR